MDRIHPIVGVLDLHLSLCPLRRTLTNPPPPPPPPRLLNAAKLFITRPLLYNKLIYKYNDIGLIGKSVVTH